MKGVLKGLGLTKRPLAHFRVPLDMVKGLVQQQLQRTGVNLGYRTVYRRLQRNRELEKIR